MSRTKSITTNLLFVLWFGTLGVLASALGFAWGVFQIGFANGRGRAGRLFLTVRPMPSPPAPEKLNEAQTLLKNIGKTSR